MLTTTIGLSDMTDPTDATVEAAARAICAEYGDDWEDKGGKRSWPTRIRSATAGAR